MMEHDERILLTKRKEGSHEIVNVDLRSTLIFLFL